MFEFHVRPHMALAVAIGFFGATQVVSAQSVPPPLFDGKDKTYQVIPGSNLRLGDNLTSGIVVTLWQGGSVKGTGTCTQQSCPVVYDSKNLFARRSRLRLGGSDSGGGSNNPITETLRRGDQGDNVRRLQEALNRNGASITVDSNYGRGTKTAVETFQRSKGLTDDGVAGPATLRALGLG